MSKILDGIRVVDFTQSYAATLATRLLADFGAEVIKIENEESSKKIRSQEPKNEKGSAYHAYLNRGKKSVLIKENDPKSEELIKKLIASADVLCEDFVAGTMEAKGLGYNDVLKFNDDIIYASLTGFGKTGPFSNTTGYDLASQALSGVAAITGFPNSGPTAHGNPAADQYGATFFAYAVVMALIHRHKTGEGQQIDVATLDCMFTALEMGTMVCVIEGRNFERLGNHSDVIAPYDTFQTTDGYYSTGVSTDPQWDNFCDVLGIKEIYDDPRFATMELRNKNYLSALRPALQEKFSEFSRAELDDIFGPTTVPSSSVLTVKEAIESEQIKVREMVVDIDDKAIGKVGIPGNVIKMSCLDGNDTFTSAPLAGEDTEFYLNEMIKPKAVKPDKGITESMPLEGMTVIDFTHAYSGPYCTMNLADYGANVIKIERLGTGDQSRFWGPYTDDGYSGYFALYNRNKNGIAIDLRSEEGKNIVRKLFESADVVVENFKSGTIDRLGLGYEDAKAINPEIIFASVSGYGQYGPLSPNTCYDNIAVSLCGQMEVTGFPDSPPTRSGASLGDSYTGLNMAFGIACSYYRKLTQGKGNRLDVAMLDAMFSSVDEAILTYTLKGIELSRTGNAKPNQNVPYDLYTCNGGDYLTVGVMDESQWPDFCEVIGKPELVNDSRFATLEDRRSNFDEFTAIMKETFADKNMNELIDGFMSKNVPCAPCLTPMDVMKHPQILARDMLVEIDDPGIGKYTAFGIPIKFSKTPGKVRKAAPLIGQDTVKVLKSFGYCDEEIDNFIQNGVVEIPN